MKCSSCDSKRDMSPVIVGKMGSVETYYPALLCISCGFTVKDETILER